jgi:hypothetical protein
MNLLLAVRTFKFLLPPAYGKDITANELNFVLVASYFEG